MQGLNNQNIDAKSMDILYLEMKLNEYIINEEYEKAAKIRDWIVELQERLNQNSAEN